MLQRKSRQIFILAGCALILFSCSSSKQSAGTINRNDVKGTWLLENITYDGLPQNQKLKLTLLDDGNEDCLKGSTWVFPNNGNGSYSIAKDVADCTTGERSIIWSYRVENGQNILQYKKLTGGVKAKDITDGYKFNIVSATDTNLLLSSKVLFEGNTISINYSFLKK